MKRVGCVVGMALSFGAISAVASAQQEEEQRRLQQEQQQQQQLQDRAQIEQQLAQPGEFVRASELMGKNIKSADGKELAEIKNLIVDENQNRVAYVIVSYGGFLDIGDKLAPVPWQALQIDEAQDRIVLNVTEEQLKNSPRIDSVEDAKFDDRTFTNEIHTFYGTEPGALRQWQAQRVDPDRPVTQQERIAQQRAEMRGEKRICAMDKILGADVHNIQRDENLGEIKEVILDADNGFLSYAMVSYGGVLGLFEETAAVPWSALNFNPEKEMYALNATEEALKAAQLDIGDYKRLREERISRDLHTSFDTQPSWIHGYVSPEPQREDELRQTRVEGEMDKNRTSVEGKIENREMLRPTDPQAVTTDEIVVVRLRPADGPVRVIHLVPQAKLQQQNVNFQTGDDVKIDGFIRNVGGQSVIQATSITIDGQRYELMSSAEQQQYQQRLNQQQQQQQQQQQRQPNN